MAPSAEAITKHLPNDLTDVEVISTYQPPRVLTVVEPDPAWPSVYEDLASKIRSALGPLALQIRHVGSTSVPGLPAKPVIDIDVVVADPADEGSYAVQLEAEGFVLLHREPRWHGHRFLVARDDAPHACNVHVFGPDCPEVARHEILRAWLIENVEERELYARVKREAVEAGRAAGGENVMKYNARKEPVLRGILDRAFRARGLLD